MAEVIYRRGDGGDIRITLMQLVVRARIADYPRPDPVEGISVGGCVNAVGTERRGAMRRRAHAHTDARDTMRGWLCFASADPRRITTGNGSPTRLLAHETAHLLTWAGHDERWRRAVTALGAPSEAKDTRRRRR